MLRQLIYVSQAAPDLRAPDLLAILTSARAHNQRAHISGILLHNNGQFMQCIEGDPTAVAVLLDSILQDPRHAHLSVLLDRTVDARDFDCWLMGFKDFGHQHAFAECDDVIEADFLQDVKHNSKAVALLASFARL